MPISKFQAIMFMFSSHNSFELGWAELEKLRREQAVNKSALKSSNRPWKRVKLEEHEKFFPRGEVIDLTWQTTSCNKYTSEQVRVLYVRTMAPRCHWILSARYHYKITSRSWSNTSVVRVERTTVFSYGTVIARYRQCIEGSTVSL